MTRVGSGPFRNSLGTARRDRPRNPRAFIIVAALCAAVSLSACESRDDRAAEASARFAQAFSAGDYPTARIAISEALAARDDVATYWIDLARTEAALAQYEQAFAAYQRALELEPNNLEALQNMAEMYVLQRDFRRAEQTAARILAISPADPRAMLVSGYIALARNQPEGALQTAERVLARFPGDESGLLLKARALAALERRPEAIQLLENSLRVTGPTQAKLAALREFYTAAGDWPGLARTFDRLLERAPADGALRLDFARAAFGAGDAARGNGQVAAIIRLPGAASTLLEAAGDLLVEHRAVSLGAADIERLSRGAEPAARLVLARVAIDKGYAALGGRIVEPLLGGPLTSIKASALGYKALSLLEQGDAREARRLSAEALDYDETNMPALLARARAGLALGQLDEALAAAQLLAREAPARHQQLLARIHRARGNEALARSLTVRGDGNGNISVAN